jgi:hypothetical protein
MGTFPPLDIWVEGGRRTGKWVHLGSLFKIYICCVWMDDGTDDRMDDATDGWMESFISSTTSFTI